MKRPEDMTKEELQEFVKMALTAFNENIMVLTSTPL